MPVWLRLILSAAIIALLLAQVDMAVLTSAFLKASGGWLSVAALLVALEYVILSRWWSGLLYRKGYTVSFTVIFHISLVADFLGFVMPSSLGSDMVKVAGLSKYISNVTEALSSLLVFRVMNYAVMFVVALVTVLIFSARFPEGAVTSGITVTLAAAVAAMALAAVFTKTAMRAARGVSEYLKMPRVTAKLKDLSDAFSYFKKNPAALAEAAFAGGLVQVSRILFMYAVSRALGIDVSLAAFFVFVPLVTAITTIPVSVAGVGVREGGYVLLLGYMGVSAGQALGMSLLGFAMNIVVVFIGGVIYWLFGFPASEELEDLKSGKTPQ